jgi:hypothetical protein
VPVEACEPAGLLPVPVEACEPAGLLADRVYIDLGPRQE